jgi:hypothetical protein
MTGSLRLWLWTKFVKQTQPNPRLAHRAGHTIMTTLELKAVVNWRTGASRQIAVPRFQSLLRLETCFGLWVLKKSATLSGFWEAELRS